MTRDALAGNADAALVTLSWLTSGALCDEALIVEADIAAIRVLASRVRELEIDAARLEWLQQNSAVILDRRPYRAAVHVHFNRDDFGVPPDAGLRAAIDAARAVP
jgi:hypothetical protein